jgi:hypothetical protein
VIHGTDNPVRGSDTLVSIHGSDVTSDVDLAGRVLIQQYRAPSAAQARLPLELIAAVDACRSEGRHAYEHDLDAELRRLLVTETVVPNLVTQVGDQYYGERAAGIAGAPGQVTGMKLGTGSTAVAKTGAGAALVTYLSGSQKAIDGSFPASSLNGSSRQIQWKTSWTAGTINGSALREVVLVIDVLADATSTAANTIARALFGPMTLGVLDTLAITWNHLLLGA